MKILGLSESKGNSPAFSSSPSKLIEEHIRTSGVDPITSPVSILADNQEHVDAHKSDEAKASEMEHAIRHEINIKVEENPEYYTSLKKRLEEIIDARHDVRMEIAEVIQRLQELVNETRQVGKMAESLGFDETEFAFYGIIKADEGMKESDEDSLRKLTQRVVKCLQELAVIDWTMKDDVQRQMRKKVKRILRGKVPDNRLEPITLRMIDLARVRLKR